MNTLKHDRYLFPAWGISLVLHAVVVALAVNFAAQVRPVLQQETFKWDVALVDALKPQAPSEPVKQMVTPIPSKAKMTPLPPRPPVEPVQETVTHRVAPQQTVQMVHPVIEPVRPVEPNVEPAVQPKSEPVPRVEEKLVEVDQPKIEPLVEPKEPEPVRHAEPVIAQNQHVPVTAPTGPVEALTSPQEPVPPVTASTPVHESSVAATTPSNPSDTPVQVAKATVPGPDMKADHRWLVESLWRRVAELKRYPSSARLNGQEGKVILKAVIRSDGELAEVSVQQSSGHTILDTAAMEAVRLACPLHMKHAISKPEIVVRLPIVYSLAN